MSTISFADVDIMAAQGRQGLANLGNTCYMNSALQCLSNMDVLRAYFLKEAFKYEINLDNVMGSKGEVVTRFAELLNQVWNKQKSNTFSPYRLKNAIGKANSMFKGDAQHDS